jgi:hypothetical protein
MTIMKPIPESYWVKPGLFLAGEYPGHYDEYLTRQRMSAFLTAGFTVFIDLTQPWELEPYEPVLKELARVQNLDIAYSRISIQDKGIPTHATMTTILDTIEAALEKGRKIYVHCWGGVGRTGTTVGCYLVRHGMTGDQALRQIMDWWMAVPKRKYHPYSPETLEQFEFIRNWIDRLPSPAPKEGWE